MKTHSCLSLAVLLTLIVSPRAHADVCQKNSVARLRTLVLTDKTLGFALCDSTGKRCMPIGPARTFTTAELEAIRQGELKASHASTGPGAGEALLTLLFLGLAQADHTTVALSSAGHGETFATATPASTPEENKKHAENADVLDAPFLSPRSRCLDVPSLGEHIRILLRILNLSEK
jgi:hypothetical protein